MLKGGVAKGKSLQASAPHLMESMALNCVNNCPPFVVSGVGQWVDSIITWSHGPLLKSLVAFIVHFLHKS